MKETILEMSYESISPEEVRFDGEVTFTGFGNDTDGTIIAYEWYSDIDGYLGDQETFSRSGFSIGHHVISFRVQDNDYNLSDWSNSAPDGSDLFVLKCRKCDSLLGK